MNIALVDDEILMRQTLQEYLERFGREKNIPIEIESFVSGDSLLENYRASYDIIFFDIDMPGLNGFETAKRVRAIDNRVVILFVTNIAQYAINGYEVEAVDYILKPINYMDFSMKMMRAFRKVSQRADNSVLVDMIDGAKRLFVSELLYVEVFSHYLIFHTKTAQYKARGSMRDIETMLLQYNFFRIHKSYLVNLKYVSEIKASELVVGRALLPMGRKHKSEFMQEYMRYIKG